MTETGKQSIELSSLLENRLRSLQVRAREAEQRTLEKRLDQYISGLERQGITFSEEKIRQRSEVRYGKLSDIVAQLSEKLKQFDRKLSIDLYTRFSDAQLIVHYQGIKEGVSKLEFVVWENDGEPTQNQAEDQLILINFPTIEDILLSIAQG